MASKARRMFFWPSMKRQLFWRRMRAILLERPSRMASMMMSYSGRRLLSYTVDAVVKR
jgi:hypothetical protein